MQVYGGSTNSFSNSGDFTLKEGAKHFLYTPRIKGPSKIRVVPPIENGVETPQIKPGAGANMAAISDAFIVAEYVTFYGEKGYHMISPPAPEGVSDGMLKVFYEQIKKYVDEHPRSASDRWRNWLGLKGEGQKQAPRAVLKAPRQYLFVQGLLFENAGKPSKTVNNQIVPRSPVVLGIPPSAKNGLIKNMITTKDTNAPLSGANSESGDFTDLANGCMLIVEPYEHEFEDGRKAQTWYRAITGQPHPITEAQAASVYVPWNQLLNLHEEISVVMMRLAETFSADAVRFAFSEHPVYNQYIPETLKESRTPTPSSTPPEPPTQKDEEVPETLQAVPPPAPKQEEAVVHNTLPMDPAPNVQSPEAIAASLKEAQEKMTGGAE